MTMVVVNEEVGGGSCTNFSTDCLLATDDAWVNNWNDDDDIRGGGGGSKNFSCRFLAEIDETVIKMVHMDNFDAAYETVQLGQHWGVIHFMVSSEVAYFGLKNTFLHTQLSEQIRPHPRPKFRSVTCKRSFFGGWGTL
jgi:hypothetical protein